MSEKNIELLKALVANEAERPEATPDDVLAHGRRDAEALGLAVVPVGPPTPEAGSVPDAPRKRRTTTVGFSRVELDHLITLLRDNSRDGTYYGDYGQYRNRANRLWMRLTTAYEGLAQTKGYPLRSVETRRQHA